MSRVVWRPLCIAIILLSVSVEHKQAANVGGSGKNIVNVETTTEEVTTSKGLFVNNGPFNFTVQSGTKVTLHCRVELQDENTSVSWLKRKGETLQLLSVNTDVFKDEPRYRVNYIKPFDWQFFIFPVNSSDQGHYECQVSSHPPIVYSVYLHVLDSSEEMYQDQPDITNEGLITTTETSATTVTMYIFVDCDVSTSAELATKDPLEHEEEEEDTITTNNEDKSTEETEDTKFDFVPELEIADERNFPIKNKFYNSGSTIELRCLIVKVPQPTQFIIWKHNSTILNYDTTRGGISVKTDILPDGAKSQLFIANVGPSDSGNYTCSLGDALTWVSVVVITGETPAAMQHGSATMSVNVGLLTILSAALSALS